MNASGDDTGSTIPLIFGFFVIALLVVAGSIALGAAFVQQRDLQDVCDGAAAAAAASSADLDRRAGVLSSESLRLAAVERHIDHYLARDPHRREVRVQARLSSGNEHITLTCSRTNPLPFGALFGRPRLRHTATSTARAALRS